jgi:hypothetical protein
VAFPEADLWAKVMQAAITKSRAKTVDASTVEIPKRSTARLTTTTTT